MTPAELRELVPAARESAYLDAATYGPAAEPTVAAIREFTDSWSRGTTRYEVWESAGEDCRRLFAALLNVSVRKIQYRLKEYRAQGLLPVANRTFQEMRKARG